MKKFEDNEERNISKQSKKVNVRKHIKCDIIDLRDIGIKKERKKDI